MKCLIISSFTATATAAAVVHDTRTHIEDPIDCYDKWIILEYARRLYLEQMECITQT